LGWYLHLPQLLALQGILLTKERNIPLGKKKSTTPLSGEIIPFGMQNSMVPYTPCPMAEDKKTHDVVHHWYQDVHVDLS
jgi:hypothetical protein